MLTTEDTKKAAWATWILTIVLGLMITLVRSVMPMHVKITAGIVILEGILEMCICIAVVWLNHKALKGILFRKFTIKDLLKIIVCFAIVLGGNILFQIIISIISQLIGIDLVTKMTEAPAAIVASQFFAAFPIGVIITTCITAPLMEEVIFRMTLKNMLINNVLFIVISPILFAFVHTANFFAVGMIQYIVMGIIFAGLYLKTKDLRLVLCAHMLNNIMGAVITMSH